MTLRARIIRVLGRNQTLRTSIMSSQGIKISLNRKLINMPPSQIPIRGYIYALNKQTGRTITRETSRQTKTPDLCSIATPVRQQQVAALANCPLFGAPPRKSSSGNICYPYYLLNIDSKLSKLPLRHAHFMAARASEHEQASNQSFRIATEEQRDRPVTRARDRKR